MIPIIEAFAVYVGQMVFNANRVKRKRLCRMMLPCRLPRRDHAMLTSELDYQLPPELIATRPVEPRDAARLLVARISAPDVEHRAVTDLPDLLRAGDVLVVNETAVLPARFRAVRADTGGRVEGLFLERHDDGAWSILARSGSRLREGIVIELLDHALARSGLTLTLLSHHRGEWRARPSTLEPPELVLGRLGVTPLPPYILKARGECAPPESDDRDWYQTVYAQRSRARSVAAPTAGLHFTRQLLDRLHDRGVELQRVTLHVGAGTFKPIEADVVERHDMHDEAFEVDRAVLRSIRAARTSGRRVIAVGTTTVRLLESIDPAVVDEAEGPAVLSGRTSLLIAPPFRFRWIDGLMTNFHLPRSTLLALVASLLGLDRLKSLYTDAIGRRYRFYSYGDAMLILP
jgi:S-adenosylmethionine:tRNA ribosyltransferase-isomerase